MDSISKSRLSNQQIDHLVTHHMGSSLRTTRVEELRDGLFNAAYHVALTDGTDCVLKVAPPPDVRVMRYELGIMRAEVDVTRLVRQRTSMPVPEVLWHDTDCQVIDVECYAMSAIPGVPLHRVRRDLSAEAQARVDLLTGRYLREMNAIEGRDYGLYADAHPRHDTWRDAFDLMMRLTLDDGRDMKVDVGCDYDVLYGDLAAHYGALDEVQCPCLVHWDLWDGNIIVDPDTGEINGIVDFERALWGDPLMEISFGAYEPNGDFARGYAANLLASPASRVRRLLYDIYVHLIMVVECYFRLYADDGQERWARRQLADEIAKLRAIGC